MRRRLFVPLVCLALLLAACSSSASTASDTTPVTTTPGTVGSSVQAAPTTAVATTLPSDPAKPSDAAADYAVGTRDLTVVDSTRPTAASASRSLSAADSRTLELLILYPANGKTGGDPVADATVAKGRFPVVEFSHGVTATGPAYQPFLRSWASAGYVVVAPTFPLTSGPDGRSSLTDYQNQPADVSFILDEIVALDVKPGDPFNAHLATGSLAVAGHSLGAITTFGFYNSCCADPRLSAAIEISGAELPFPDGNFDSPVDLPLLLLHGEQDQTVPYRGSAEPFESLTGPRALLSFPNAGHIDLLFSEPANPLSVAVTVAFLDLQLRDGSGRWNALRTQLETTKVANLQLAGGLEAPA